MYIPSLTYDSDRVPKLSKRNIENIAENFLLDFQPQIFTDPQPTEIDEFTEYYLGMISDYQYLSHNGIYLGMTIFNDTDKIPVYDPVNKRAEYISAVEHTVIIERRLVEDMTQEHRYRFTLGHEAGHDIFHLQYFKVNLDILSLLKIKPLTQPMILCRKDSIGASRKYTDNWGIHERLEWQANCFSAALLMPQSAVDIVLNESYSYEAVDSISQIFNVSKEAASYRIKEISSFK